MVNLGETWVVGGYTCVVGYLWTYTWLYGWLSISIHGYTTWIYVVYIVIGGYACLYMVIRCETGCGWVYMVMGGYTCVIGTWLYMVTLGYTWLHVLYFVISVYTFLYYSALEYQRCIVYSQAAYKHDAKLWREREILRTNPDPAGNRTQSFWILVRRSYHWAPGRGAEARWYMLEAQADPSCSLSLSLSNSA